MRRQVRKDTPRLARLRYGMVSTLLLIAVLAVLAGLCILVQRLEKKNAWKADLSFNAQTSYGQATEAVLAGLDSDVHAYVLYQEDQVLFDLMDRYAAATPHFTWERTDLTLNPGLAARFRSALPENTIDVNTIVFWCESTNRYRVVRYDQLITWTYDSEGELEVTGLRYESAITSAIRYVSSGSVPRILILQGHGEMKEEDAELLAYLWDSNAYDVYYYSLNTTQTTLRPDDLLVILSPTADFSDAEYAQILEFTRQGGCLLIACDPSTPVAAMPNFTQLLRLYNFSPKEGIVYAEENETATYYAPYRNYLIPALQYTEITAPMVQSGSTGLLLPDSRAFAVSGDTDNYVVTDAVLSSGSGSYLVPYARASGDGTARADTDEGGPFALALLSKRVTEDGYASISRAFIIGSSPALTDASVYARTDTQEFILRITDTLFGHPSTDVGIMAKDAVRPQLSARSHGAGTLAVFMLPAAVAAAAVVVLSARKRK